MYVTILPRYALNGLGAFYWVVEFRTYQPAIFLTSPQAVLKKRNGIEDTEGFKPC